MSWRCLQELEDRQNAHLITLKTWTNNETCKLQLAPTHTPQSKISLEHWECDAMWTIHRTFGFYSFIWFLMEIKNYRMWPVCHDATGEPDAVKIGAWHAQRRTMGPVACANSLCEHVALEAQIRATRQIIFWIGNNIFKNHELLQVVFVFHQIWIASYL